ncbi:MAG: threonylcarbamoyl-AMP synthase [Hahellaceae bacterium]|nr:threonylcarbamoyl-AMP synthase [Hahellaceae bacterium]
MAHVTRQVEEAAARLNAGGLVAMPTETVYGLAARADLPEAVAQVFRMKGRPSTNPLIVHLSDASEATAWAADIPDIAKHLMQHFWPGPLTLVFQARPEVSRHITAGQDTVALRVPAHSLARQLIQAVGHALVAPSANRYMSVSPTTAEHVVTQFSGEDLLILDGGPSSVGLESTILSALPGDTLRLLRPGMLDLAAVEVIAGESVSDDVPDTIRVPGQHRRHYAPHTRLCGFSAADAGAWQQDLADSQIGWILCGSPIAPDGPAIQLGAEADAYARRFYDALYQLDARKLKRIWVERPPEGARWQAIRNRLERAITPPD